jgi:hypothetical protein
MVTRLYRVPGPGDPIAQGDIFKDLPVSIISFEEHLIEGGGTYSLRPVRGDLKSGMQFLAGIDLVSAMVISQSCDVQRDMNILVAPLIPLELSSTKPQRQWSELQNLATSLHQPTRVYLPDDPELSFPRRTVELGEAFSLPRAELESFSRTGKRVAALGKEGIEYLQFRLAVMFWRVARDDYAWPSKADLELKNHSIQASIEKEEQDLKSKEKLVSLSKSLEEESETLQIEIEEIGSKLASLKKEQLYTRHLIEGSKTPSSGEPSLG